MTHPNHQTNGASLEDCHTNFFALTELCGIKWRKLVWGEGGGCREALEDPVISSYARCLAGDILCVWRRVSQSPPPSNDVFDPAPPPPPRPPPLSLSAAKELWIFWYGEEPDLTGLVSSDLLSCQSEQGSWESGLSYECRSLLFKALHNLIEKCLLSRDFVRLGKWFVQPYDGDEDDIGKSGWHLSFSFAFFVHGESTVCASVDVRQHPAVRTLPRRRRRAPGPSPAAPPPPQPAAIDALAPADAADTPTNTRVILAPFGLEGVVTGREWAESEAGTARLLDHWRQLYPLDANTTCLEVLVGGVRLRYPRPYVLVAELPEAAPPAPAAPPRPAATLALRTLRALTHPHTSIDGANGELSEKMEMDFVDPTRKTVCTCSKWRRGRRERERDRERERSKRAPFHRRHERAHALAPAPSPAPVPPPGPAQSVSGCGAGGCGSGGGGAGSSSPPSLPASPPHSQPSSADPHQPHAQNSVGPAESGNGGGSGGGVAAALAGTGIHTPAPTPDPHAPPTPVPPTPTNAPSTKLYQGSGESPSGAGSGTGAPNSLGGGGGSGATGSGGAGGADEPGGACELLKRPVLPVIERTPHPLDLEHELSMLYDYTSVHAWLEHPVKRFKREDGEWGAWGGAVGAGGLGTNADLYAGHTHTRMAPHPTHPAHLTDGGDAKHDHNDDNKDKNLFTSDGLFPSIKDLDHLFENSDDAASGDETGSGCGGLSAEGRGAWGGGGGATEARCRQEELSKMFPTPPSMEPHPQPSPSAFTLPEAEHALQSCTPCAPALHAQCAPHSHARHATHVPLGTPPPDPIDDWSYVWRAPLVCMAVGSSKYAALPQLPSAALPPLPPAPTYRPRAPPPPPPQHTPAPPPAHAPTSNPATPALHHHTPQPVKRSASPASAGCVGRLPPPYSDGGGGGGGPVSVTSLSGVGGSCSGGAAPLACPLLLNVLLADTVLNIFRDHNFDSCTLCVCNASARVVGNIRGGDATTYLNGVGWWGESPPASPQPHDDEPIRCSCGFSAVVNRRLAHHAGLFYEDEMEITGLAEDPGAAPTSGPGLAAVTDVVLAMCAAPSLGGAATALGRAARDAAHHAPADELKVNVLEYSDGGDAAAIALRAAALAPPLHSASQQPPVHRWPFIGAKPPRSSRDVVRLMRRLRPLLQDAIQKRCCGARMWDGVTGPLTWRQFHRLAGRGTEDMCEPQPVPPLLVGYDRDWLSISPYALTHWERLALEPYSYARDVAFAVLAPDCDSLVEPIRTFFKELSTVYESCRLGRHVPIERVGTDGVVRATGGGAGVASGEGGEEWAGEAACGWTAAYGAALRRLLPALAQLHHDRALFDAEPAQTHAHAHTPAPAPSPLPDHPPTPSSHSDQESEGGGAGSNSNSAPTGVSNGCSSGGGGSGTSSGGAGWGEEGWGGACVIYVVEPPWGSEPPARHLHALLQLAARAQRHALAHHTQHVTVKIISVEGVMGGVGGREMRSLALSVFSGTRTPLTHRHDVKSLTGFGTAANTQLFLHNKDEKNRAPYKLYTPAFVLAPRKSLKEVSESWAAGAGGTGVGVGGVDACGVLFVSYCLSGDQRYLLAAATDGRGELLDTAAINIDVPARARRRRAAPARRLGLSKLMDFIVGVMSQSAQPWRLVVGRLGRIGHGELKGWSWLLSRGSLVRASARLREVCAMCAGCAAVSGGGAPAILSACLVSTEPDSCLRLMPDRFTPDERFSQAAVASHLHTPRDATATHILVFPTSATTQSSQTAFQEQHLQNGEGDDILFPVLPENEEMGEGMDNMNDIIFSNDLFSNMWSSTSPGGSDGAAPGGGGVGGIGGAGDGGVGGNGSGGGGSGEGSDGGEAVGGVLQQPLALGYLVSTAPLGAMPAWWWAGSAHLRGACPAFLKNALHLHSPALHHNEDVLTAHRPHHHDATHPLDSHITTDVLRYVLEGYNALSWLALEGAAGEAGAVAGSEAQDRRSCLPLHVQLLMQLYYTTQALS